MICASPSVQFCFFLFATHTKTCIAKVAAAVQKRNEILMILLAFMRAAVKAVH